MEIIEETIFSKGYDIILEFGLNAFWSDLKKLDNIFM